MALTLRDVLPESQREGLSDSLLNLTKEDLAAINTGGGEVKSLSGDDFEALKNLAKHRHENDQHALPFNIALEPHAKGNW